MFNNLLIGIPGEWILIVVTVSILNLIIILLLILLILKLVKVIKREFKDLFGSKSSKKYNEEDY